MSYYPELDSHIKNKREVDLNLPINGKKSDSNVSVGIHTSNLVAKKKAAKNLSSIKAQVDKLDVVKFSNAVDNIVAKKVVNNKLNLKINTINTNIPKIRLVSKCYDSEKHNIEKICQ